MDPEDDLPDEDYENIDVELDGEALPPFASEENKALDAEVKDKNRVVSKLDTSIAENSERVKIMTEHLHNVQQELVHTQGLQDAKKREVETEEHMKALAARQTGRLRAEIARLKGMGEEYQDRTNQIQGEIFHGNEKLDQFKLEMNWNQEELEQWALAARQKEEDEMTLQKYQRADDSKIRELTLAIERLTVENATKRKELEAEVTETQAAQIEMDKTAEQFRQLHEDRKRLIQRWEEAVTSMKHRDSQLESLGHDFEENLKRKEGKEEKLKEKQKFLQESENENKKVETQITNTDRQLARIRIEHMNVKAGLQEFKDEVEILKNQLAAAATDQANRRHQLVVKCESLEHRKKRCTQLQDALQSTQKRLKDEQDQTRKKEESAAAAEQFHTDMENRKKEVDKKLKEVKEELFRESQQLYALRTEEATTLGEISGAQSATKNLQFQISRLDHERQRQEELLYAVDFQSQLQQRKVARVSGERTFEEKEEMTKKIEQLEKHLEDQKGLWNILSKQIKKQDAELRSANRHLAGTQKESEKMKVVMEELELQNEITNRTVANTMKDKEEVLVHHDVMKLEVKRLRGILAERTEQTFALENRKAQLQISMEEREKEIEVHQEVLKSSYRVSQEERHKLALELADRQKKIYNLKMKYETVMAKTAKDEGGEQHSQAYYVLKAAQAREELQRQGDELDAKIRKAEREIRALENTLSHLLQRNQKYKENFKQVDSKHAAEQEEKGMLEEQSRAANEVLFKKKKQLGQLDKEYEEDERRHEEIVHHRQQLNDHIRDLLQARENINNDLEEQRVKIERARNGMQRAKQQAVEAGNLPDGDTREITVAELDVVVKVGQQETQALLQTVHDAVSRHSDVVPLLNSLLQEKGLPVPASSRPGSRQESRPESAASRRSSRQSSRPESARSSGAGSGGGQ
mmetsp:Transcript_91480/g.244969  ORF Transcript_91480/g.244969 Transcript_91480/m.244969 type:complete len:925 (-) Transcript_91480:135-2909(-)